MSLPRNSNDNLYLSEFRYSEAWIFYKSYNTLQTQIKEDSVSQGVEEMEELFTVFL